MRTILEITSACNVWFLSYNLLLSEDWRLEMMKALDRPESFSKKFSKLFSSKYLKKEDAMLLATGFATVSQIANYCEIPCCIIRFCYS